MRLRPAVAAALSAACLAAPSAISAPAPVPSPADLTVANLQVVSRPAAATASWTATVRPTRPQPLNEQGVLTSLAGAQPLHSRAAMPADADAVVTVSDVMSTNPIDFESTPVFTPHTAYPLLWARKAPSGAANPVSGTNSATAMLSPTDTYQVAVVGASWPAAYGPAAPVRGHGHLVVSAPVFSTQTVGYNTPAGHASAAVHVGAGMLTAAGGAVSDHDKNHSVVVSALPEAQWAQPDGMLLVYYLTPASAPVVAWSLAGTAGHLKLVASIQGTLPAGRVKNVGGAAVQTEGVPFLVVAVDGVIGSGLAATPAVPAGTKAAMVTPAGGHPIVVQPGVPLRLAQQQGGPNDYDACLFGMGQDNPRDDVSATAATAGAPGLTGWRVGHASRAELGSIALASIDIDGTSWSPNLSDAVSVVWRPLVSWEDDIADVTGEDFYDAFTDRCLFGDTTGQSGMLQHWQGLRFGTEQRAVFVHAGVLIEVRVAAAPDSRLTYTQNGQAAEWPVSRVRVSAFSLDGLLHQVSVTTKVTFTRSMTMLTPNGAGVDEPMPAGSYPTEQVNYRFTSGSLSDMLASGNLSPGTFGRDYVGRSDGFGSTVTVSSGSSGTQLVCSSDPEGAAAAPTYGTGFLTAIIAQS